VPSVNESSEIAGVLIVDMDVHGDDRGTFVETWRREWFPGAADMMQASRSDKSAGSVVGLHYHLRQADFWCAVQGRARVVLHDLRASSPTRGMTMLFELTGDGHRGVYVPPGVAHGFAALSDFVLWYMVDRYYDPDDELGVAWDDPELAIDWGVAAPVVSERDRSNPRRSEIPEDRQPR
jgi:dTDP-4-dehydrorhamnose 3,5-epimerase